MNSRFELMHTGGQIGILCGCGTGIAAGGLYVNDAAISVKNTMQVLTLSEATLVC